MKKNKTAKVLASFQIVIVTLSIVAFSYMIGQANIAASPELQNQNSFFSQIKLLSKVIIEKIRQPMIPVVSAEGCCQSGNECSTVLSSDLCTETYSDSISCEDLAGCEVGCCYDPNTGELSDAGVINANCNADEEYQWYPESECSTQPNLDKGCCITTSYYYPDKTQIWCDYYAGTNDDTTTWVKGMSAAACTIAASAEVEGACVAPDGTCKFVKGSACTSPNIFNPNFLCSAGSLIGSVCGMPPETLVKTTCVDGKEGVYFLDNCSQPANIYDSSKVDNKTYWTKVIYSSKSCNPDSGNANSISCGNCDSTEGGICSEKTSEDTIALTFGDHYCKSTSCSFNIDRNGSSETVQTGESWCMYDGAVGNGDDIVGSSHWRYYCDYGEVKKELCIDEFRNGICTGGVDNGKYYATCEPNAWRSCLELNVAEGGLNKQACIDNPACNLTTVDLGGKYFNFTACSPAYPPGFDIGLTESVANAALNDLACDLGDFTCIIPREPQGVGTGGEDGGCMYVEDPDSPGVMINEKCGTEEFFNQLNNFCRSLGDCGLSVNINNQMGQGSGKSYKIIYENFTDMDDGEFLPTDIKRIINYTKILSINESNATYDQMLHDTFIKATHGSIALGNYTELLASMGIESIPTLAEELEEWNGMIGESDISLSAISGSSALAVAGFFLEGGITNLAIKGGAALKPTLASAITSAVPVLLPLGLAVAGAAAGYWLSETLGVSAEGTTWAFIIAGAGLGLAIGSGIAMAMTSVTFLGVLGLIAGALIAIGFGIWAGIAAANEDDCDQLAITYNCEPFVPPLTTGNECESCNDDPETCSSYRCHSIGINCQYYSSEAYPDHPDDQRCQTIPDDHLPPTILGIDNIENTSFTITPPSTEISNTAYSSEIKSGGIQYVTVGPASGGAGCFNARDSLILTLNISEPAVCRFTNSEENPGMSFGEMTNDFGYTTAVKQQILPGYRLPDLAGSNGQPDENWNETIKLFVKCQDIYDDITQASFGIQFCVGQGLDVTKPEVFSYEPENGKLTGFDTDSQGIKLVMSESAECKWSLENIEYSSMSNDNNFTCLSLSGSPVTTVQEPSICTATLPISGDTNEFYISCRDQPWKALSESNTKNVKYTLNRPSSKIQIKSISPDYNQEVSSIADTFEYEITTTGGGENHKCIWSKTGYKNMNPIPNRFVKGDITSTKHTIHPYMSDGSNTIYVNCSDETGDTVSSELTVEISVDRSAPTVTRIWQDQRTLHVATDENSECKYSTESCNFIWSEAPKMSSDIDHTLSTTKGQTYYIKCEDKYGHRPLSGCSAEIVAL